MVATLRIPLLLDELVSAGRWPRTAEEATAQNTKSLSPPERVAQLAPEETAIHLDAPPFATLTTHAHFKPKFWRSAMLAPEGLDFDLAILIADFGLGSDAPIVLDYRENLIEPRVLRLRWRRPEPNTWMLMAPDFRTFVDVLGL